MNLAQLSKEIKQYMYARKSVPMKKDVIVKLVTGDSTSGRYTIHELGSVYLSTDNILYLYEKDTEVQT